MMMKTKDISTKDYKKALHLKEQALEPIVNTNLQTGKLADLLKYPNDLETFEDFITYGSLYKLITGDTYIWGDILGGGANQGIPNQLWNLPAQHMTILITDQFPARPAAYKLFMWNQSFTPQQVLHEIYANPNWNINGEQLYGFSPLRSMLRNTIRNNYAKEATIAKFQNGGFEELIYVNDNRFTPEEGKSQAEAIKKILMSPEYRGSHVQGRVATSGIPMGSVPMGRSPVEMGYIDSERWDAVMFCNAYGVPSEMLGLTNKTFNNIKEAEKALTLRSAIPLLTSRRNALNRKITTDWGFAGKNVYIDYDTECFPELQSDQATTSQWLSSMILMTPDEQREYLGVDSLNTPESTEVWVKTSTGYVPLTDFQATQTDQQLNQMINDTVTGMMNNNNANGQQGNGQANVKPKPAAAGAN
jgi:phage portal protein BeeE